MAKTYFITGGAGNLASQITFPLAADGHRVILFDVESNPVGKIAPGSRYVQGDLTDEKQLKLTLREHKPDCVIHLASLLSGQSEQDRKRAWTVNFEGTFFLFESILEQGIPQILYPSSLASYGGDLPDPLPENYAQWPCGLYGVSKVTAERLGVYYHDRHGIDFRCLRLPIVISQYSHAGAASAYASQIFIQTSQRGSYTCKVNPETRCSVIYAPDVIRGMVEFLNTPQNQLSRCVYNIHGFSPSATELAQAVIERTPSAKIVFEPESPTAEIVASWPNILEDSSSRSDWGWSPHFNLENMADHFMEALKHVTSNPPSLSNAS